MAHLGPKSELKNLYWNPHLVTANYMFRLKAGEIMNILFIIIKCECIWKKLIAL